MVGGGSLGPFLNSAVNSYYDLVPLYNFLQFQFSFNSWYMKMVLGDI